MLKEPAHAAEDGVVIIQGFDGTVRLYAVGKTTIDEDGEPKTEKHPTANATLWAALDELIGLNPYQELDKLMRYVNDEGCLEFGAVFKKKSVLRRFFEFLFGC